MEALIKRYHNMSLRTYFVFSVIVTFCLILLLSFLTIGVCTAFRERLLPESNTVYLTIDQTYSDETVISQTYTLVIGNEEKELPVLIPEGEALSAPVDTRYTIQRIENSLDSLSPKRKMAYQVLGGIMIILPAMFSVLGILLCGFHFYKQKLDVPLTLLSDATEQISNQNLDFQLKYNCMDEMGKLCGSFEQMRKALYENYKELWNTLEERKLLQASIAHDLRNPIAMIEGYAEYLQLNIEKGRLSEAKILKIAGNIRLAAKRMEDYTESVRTLNQMEDIEIVRQEILPADFISGIREDLEIIAEKSNISLTINNTLTNDTMLLDCSILYRIIENVFNNALRFARTNITIDFSRSDHILNVIISDDGDGFTNEVLKRQSTMFFAKPSEEGHLGIGLPISRLLCKKHGGNLSIENNSKHHAVIKINVMI